MKQAWVQIDEWSDELIAAAVESGADALVLPPGYASAAKSLCRINVVSADGDLVPGEDVLFEDLKSAGDEARIRELLQVGKTIIIVPHRGDDAILAAGGAASGMTRAPAQPSWEVIPLENLVAGGRGSLLVPVDSIDRVELALGVLEKGVTGVVIRSDDPAIIRELVGRVKRSGERVGLELAIVEGISAAGMGDRVCVDTCTHMVSGEGMLVGNSSGFLFLVQAETEENPYVAPRPFRVNAGPVHSYISIPDGRTCYLSELGAGKRVLVFGPDGSAREATVGRVKIERRPLLLIDAVCGEKRGSILLQNAETIRLTQPDGQPVSVARLKAGDSVLIAPESAGRHFGMKIEETIQEN